MKTALSAMEHGCRFTYRFLSLRTFIARHIRISQPVAPLLIPILFCTVVQAQNTASTFGGAAAGSTGAVALKATHGASLNPGIMQPNGVVRFAHPIMSPDPALSETRVFNPSVILKGNRLVMLYRANIGDDRKSQIQLAFSADGKTFKPYSRNPVLTGPWGVEDPRVVLIGKMYSMTYVCNREHGPQQQCLATSTDLIHWRDRGVVLRPQNEWDKEQVKAAVIVPRKIGGKYVMYFVGQALPWHTSIGVAVSDDLLHWKEPLTHPVMTAREDHFDSLGIEPGATPILLPQGILLVYNGWNPEHVHKTAWVLFSRKNPAQMIARSEVPFIEPQFPYEIEGRNAFTFTEGAVRYRGKWLFYYGAADRAIGLAEVTDLNTILRNTSANEQTTQH